MKFLGNQVSITFEIPMAEVVMDFFDRLKSCSRGFASLDYNFVRFESSALVKVDVLINSEKVDALAMICHRNDARHRGIALVENERLNSSPNVRCCYSGSNRCTNYCPFYRKSDA